MYCIKCGKKNISGYAFCYNCGAQLLTPQELEALHSKATAEAEQATTPGTERPAGASPEESSPPPVVPPWFGSGPGGPNWTPPPGGPYGTPGQYEPGTGWRPPFPYGYPPLPRRGETQRFPVAPNGKPFIVLDHPESFHDYKNKDDKQVYAAFATFQARFYAVLIDTLLIFMPLQLLAILGVVIFDDGLRQRVAEAARVRDQTQLNLEFNNAVPGWLTLAVLTAYLLYCVLMTWRAGGQTIGKKLLRIKIIRKDGTTPDFVTALSRNLFGYCLGLSGVAATLGSGGALFGLGLQIMVLLGFSSAFSNPKRQGWHDRLAETLVVGRNELVQGVNY